MFALIALGGNCVYSEELQVMARKCDKIIAADSGYVHLEHLGIKPENLVGDMDSIPDEYLARAKTDKTIHITEYDKKKDMTDSEIAGELAIKNGCDGILFIGAIGNRPDHVLGNQMYAVSLAMKGIQCVLTDGMTWFYTVTKKNSPFKIPTEGKLPEENIISIVPVNSDLKDVRISGLEYELESELLEFGSQRAVSNTITGSKNNAYLSVSSGVAFLISTKEDSD